MNKMYVEVYQNNEIKNTWKNQQDITMQLLSYFFRYKHGKYNNFKIRVNEKEKESKIIIDTWFYNYKNEKEITKLIFYNVPIKYGWIDTYEINKLIENEITKKEV